MDVRLCFEEKRKQQNRLAKRRSRSNKSTISDSRADQTVRRSSIQADTSCSSSEKIASSTPVEQSQTCSCISCLVLPKPSLQCNIKSVPKGNEDDSWASTALLDGFKDDLPWTKLDFPLSQLTTHTEQSRTIPLEQLVAPNTESTILPISDAYPTPESLSSMWNTFEFGEQAPIPSVCSPPPLLPREASLDIDTSSTMLWLPSDGFTDSKAPATAVARAALDAFVLPPEIANAPILDQLEARPQEPCLGRIVSNEHTTRSPLHAASKNGHTEVMRVLLAKGVAIDCVDQAGLTALHHAALCGNVEGVVLLLQYNADTSIEDHEGCTALYHAASAGYEAIVRILT